MAYDKAGLSGPLQFGFDKKLYYYTSTADSVATIAAAGYMNNDDDNLRLENSDQMVVKDSANRVGTLEVVNSTGGAVTFYVLPGGDGPAETSTGGALSAYGVSFLNSTQAFTLHTAPVRAGQEKKIVALVAGGTVTTTGGAPLIGQASTAVLGFTKAYGAVELTAFSSTNWVITSSPLFDVSTTGETRVNTS